MRSRNLARRAALLAALALPTAYAVVASAGPDDSAAGQRAALWADVSAEPYEDLPDPQGLDLVASLSKSHLRKAFDQDTDVRDDRRKTFHDSGTVALVDFVPAGAEGLSGRVDPGRAAPEPCYTGLFRSGAAGLVRLSLADDAGAYIPGVALKLFVDGQPSKNVLAIPDFNVQSSSDFFARSPTTLLPGPDAVEGWLRRQQIRLFAAIQRRAVPEALKLSLNPLAEVDRSGAPVADPCAPNQVIFRPGEVAIPADAEGDFRELIAEHARPGAVLYRLYAKDAGSDEERFLGELRLESEFVASAFGDRRLHFVHHEWTEAAAASAGCPVHALLGDE